MSCRHRNADSNLRSWLRGQRAALLELGMPLSVLGDDQAWTIFLEDGVYPPASGSARDIDVDAMPVEQAQRVLDFLSEHFSERNEQGYSPYRAINRLEAILRRGPHAV
jgi:hypothetical protein